MLNGRRLLGEDLKTLPFCESEQARMLLQAQGVQPSLIKDIPAAVWGRWHGTLWLKGDWPLDNSKAYLKHGKAAGILTPDRTLAQHYLKLGCTFVAVGVDARTLAIGVRELRAAFKN
jgi:hypothetical protein